jgi:hypothetical protein
MILDEIRHTITGKQVDDLQNGDYTEPWGCSSTSSGSHEPLVYIY